MRPRSWLEKTTVAGIMGCGLGSGQWMVHILVIGS